MITVVIVVTVLSLLIVGFCFARFLEIIKWSKVIRSIEVGVDGSEFLDGVFWVYAMIFEKKDTRYEPKTD